MPTITASNQVVSAYHELLTTVPGLIERTKSEVWQRLKDVRFVFDNRMLSPYLRPYFITRERFEFISAVCQGIWGAVSTVGQLALTSVELQDYLGLTEAERILIRTDPKFRGISRLSRFDSFLGDEFYQFVELNAETPAGVAYSEVAADIFSELEVMKLFRQRFALTQLPGRKVLLDSLLNAYQEFSGSSKQPQIAIVDFRGLPTQREFELVRDYFEANGYRTIIADPRELEFSGGRLRKGDFEIDLVYKRLLVNEFMEKKDECDSLLQAYQSQAVCMVNSFRGKLIHKKLLFGVLTDERFQQLFSATQKELIQRHIPWTRRMEDRTTTFRGDSIELIEFVRRNRDSLVLKPNDDYGGKGIFIGWQSTQSAWDNAIQTAIAGDYLVQYRVATSREIYPQIGTDGAVSFVEQLVDLDPLLYDGTVGGAFTRLSGSELANVTAGGGMVPVFIVEGER